MSDTPPDRKEESGAPDGPRNPYVGFVVLTIVSLILYVLSAGPVVWLITRHYLPDEVAVIYIPLEYLIGDYRDLLHGYLYLWHASPP